LSTAPRRSLLAGLRGLLADGLELVRTRGELLVVEYEEEKARLLRLLAWGAAALILLAAGLVFSAVFITVLLWESNRLLALGVFSALFLGGGFIALNLAMAACRPRSRAFDASLNELAEDQAALRGTPRP
jgi:uncharacterized membrane protein YqjE